MNLEDGRVPRQNDNRFIPPLCPICRAASDRVRYINEEKIRQTLVKYFDSTFATIETGDYTIRRCCTCTLEFADPLHPGSANFYEQLGRQVGYYPATRWEWDYVLAGLEAGQIRTLLEVGCGSGKFMHKAQSVTNCKVTGVDINSQAIEECRAKGFEAFCETAEEHLDRTERQYDCTVAFHCLEHVNAPFQFARTLFNLTRPGGLVIFSTPLSPMSFEGLWYDPLNHPPHHMTRWNPKSYETLAACLGMQCHLFSSPAASAVSRAAVSLALSTHRTPKSLNRLTIMKSVLLRPHLFVSDLVRQRIRQQIGGKPAGDILLGVFSKGTSQDDRASERTVKHIMDLASRS